VNRTPFVGKGGWTAAVSNRTSSAQQQATFAFFAYMSTTANLWMDVLEPMSFIGPSKMAHLSGTQITSRVLNKSVPCDVEYAQTPSNLPAKRGQGVCRDSVDALAKTQPQIGHEGFKPVLAKRVIDHTLPCRYEQVGPCRL
jgi:hypothetical protein